MIRHPMIDIFSESRFQGFSKLPPALVPSSLQLVKFSGKFMIVSGNAKWFDWAGFTIAARGLGGENLSVARYTEKPISETECSVGWMVNEIVNYLVNILSMTVDDEFRKELTANVGATFENVRESSSRGFLDFDVSTTGTNSSMEYRVLFAMPSTISSEQFHSIVCTITLSAYIHDVSEWWGLSHSTTKNFSAQINALELVVQKGFKNPQN